MFLSAVLKKLFFVACAALLSVSCHKDAKPNATETKTPVTAQRADIVLGLTPTLDALPFYVAQESGIYDSLGLKVHIDFFDSQMDAEEALANGKLQACTSDMFRTAVLQNRKKPVKMLFGTNRHWLLVANKALRVSKIKQISSRMVGATRNSVPAYLCSYFRTQMTTTKGPMLLPQVNSIVIRERMLEENQIDAAVLPQPQALLACMKGHTSLFSSDKKYDGYAGVAVRTEMLDNPTKARQTGILRKGYNLAVEQLAKEDTLKISDVAIKKFNLSGLTTHIKPKESFTKISDLDIAKAKTAAAWLKAQNQVRTTYTADTLLAR